MLDWQLTGGAGAIAILALGVLAFGFLLVDRSRRWWRRQVPISVGVGALVAVLATLCVDYIWRPWPDPLPIVVPLAVGVTVAALMLALLRPAGWRRRTVATLAVAMVALSSSAQVNVYFEAYGTLRQLLGMPAELQVAFDNIPHPTAPGSTSSPSSTSPSSASRTRPSSSLPSSTPALSTTTNPAPTTTAPAPQMPTHGLLTSANIPGTTSGFATRDAYIYLPAAYGFTATPLPVLVLVAGQPGSPVDWINGGKILDTMEAFAGAHGGLAPVVVVADQLGSADAQPLCVDGAAGNAFTYLSVDVPTWIKQNLVVDADPKKWAIGGMSSGGTCSLQLAVNAPSVYPTFVDISGEVRPTVGSHQRTVANVFGGDEAAFVRVNPLDVMARRTFPDTAGVVAAGKNDSYYRDDAKAIAAAATAAGMAINYFEVPGGHTFDVWAAAMAQALPWLSTRLGLTP